MESGALVRPHLMVDVNPDIPNSQTVLTATKIRWMMAKVSSRASTGALRPDILSQPSPRWRRGKFRGQHIFSASLHIYIFNSPTSVRNVFQKRLLSSDIFDIRFIILLENSLQNFIPCRPNHATPRFYLTWSGRHVIPHAQQLIGN